MSRIRYADDEGGQSPGLFDANLRRAIAGKRGQRALRDLIAGLEALPERKLLTGGMANPTGEVCPVGAYLLHKAAQKGYGFYGDREVYLDYLADIDTDYDTIDEAQRWGMTRTLAWTICEWNDELYAAHTPEERYEGILAWARAQLVEEVAA